MTQDTTEYKIILENIIAIWSYGRNSSLDTSNFSDDPFWGFEPWSRVPVTR